MDNYGDPSGVGLGMVVAKPTCVNEQQIAQALRQGEHGSPTAEICRKLGVSEDGGSS